MRKPPVPTYIAEYPLSSKSGFSFIYFLLFAAVILMCYLMWRKYRNEENS